jgi:hypothetical protein
MLMGVPVVEVPLILSSICSSSFFFAVLFYVDKSKTITYCSIVMCSSLAFEDQ